MSAVGGGGLVGLRAEAGTDRSTPRGGGNAAWDAEDIDEAGRAGAAAEGRTDGCGGAPIEERCWEGGGDEVAVMPASVAAVASGVGRRRGGGRLPAAGDEGGGVETAAEASADDTLEAAGPAAETRGTRGALDGLAFGSRPERLEARRGDEAFAGEVSRGTIGGGGDVGIRARSTAGPGSSSINDGSASRGMAASPTGVGRPAGRGAGLSGGGGLVGRLEAGAPRR